MGDSCQKKRAYVNLGLIAANVLFFLYLEIAGSSEDNLFMLKNGAMYGPLVVEGKEYYRLFTSIFMHFGIHHIMNNMLILFILGDNLERALGSVKYLFFYLICGVGANLVSLAVSMNISMDRYRDTVAAGASGAIFGVIGGLLYAVGINHGQLEDLNTRQLVVLIVCSLYFGFTSTGVDNMAHMSGLVIGVFTAALLYRRPKQKHTVD